MRTDGMVAQEDDAGPPSSHSILRLPHCSLHGALTTRCPQAVPQHAPIDVHRHLQRGELESIFRVEESDPDEPTHGRMRRSVSYSRSDSKWPSSCKRRSARAVSRVLTRSRRVMTSKSSSARFVPLPPRYHIWADALYSGSIDW